MRYDDDLETTERKKKPKKIIDVGADVWAAITLKDVESWGYIVSGGPNDTNKPMNDKIFAQIPREEVAKIDAVVCGYDPGFNFYKMSITTCKNSLL